MRSIEGVAPLLQSDSAELQPLLSWLYLSLSLSLLFVRCAVASVPTLRV